MKILHILDHSIPLQSGYTFRTRNILRHQRELGWETVHVTGLKHQGAEKAEEDIEGLHFYRTLSDSSLLMKLPVINQWHVIHTLANRISEVIEKEKPDVLHAHSPALNGMAALQANRKYGLPVVYECRAFWEDAAVDHGTSSENGIRYKITRRLESKVFREADRVTTICEGLRKDIVNRGIPSDKVTVIPNAVDVSHFTYGAPADASLKQSLGLDGKQVLGFIGSFYAYEGLPLLLDALPAMLHKNPDIRVLLVGGGPQEALVKQKIQELGIQGKVILTGRVPHNEVQSYYNLVDLLIYPRLDMRLTDLVTPLKPLEAMAQGKVLVASDVGGHKELIEDGKTGFLFPSADIDALAKKVLEILADFNNMDRIRQNAREFVEKQRNWTVSVGNYRSVYNKGGGA